MRPEIEIDRRRQEISVEEFVSMDTILSICREIAKDGDIVAATLYGSRAAGYARKDSDHDILLVIRGYAEEVRYHYVSTDEGQLAVLAVDQDALEKDVEKGVFGDFVAGRLLTPHVAVLNEDYIRRVEVAVKKRFAEEDLRDLVLEYGELTCALTILPAYLVLVRMEKRARAYSPLRYSYANILRPDLRDRNLSLILDGYNEALTQLDKEGLIKFDGEHVRFKTAFVDKVLSYKMYNRVVNFVAFSRRTFNSYVTHGKAGKVTLDIVAKELASKLKREIQMTVHRQGLGDPKDFLFLETDKGLLSLNETDSMIERLKGIHGGTNITAKALGTALNEVYFIEIDGERFVAKKYTDWYNFKWFILNVVALGTKVFSTQGKARLSNEYVTNRLLTENGILVPEIVSVSIPDRLLVERYVEGKSVLDIIIEMMSSDGLSREYERLAFEIGQTLAKIHSFDVVLGDCKPENFILNHDGKLYVLDLEQGERHGDPSWDVAQFLYFSGHFGNRFSEGFREFVGNFIKGYLTCGKPKVLKDAALMRYSKTYLAWTPILTLQEISEQLKKI
ncbi:nucleotidyltransferase domain-containing protein [Candidatus Bathyarchaeota archaeon]|nr:nucleotidyltransferase domain-containing protein [Candidatus Bathyarchaeota archaeon]